MHISFLISFFLTPPSVVNNALWKLLYGKTGGWADCLRSFTARKTVQIQRSWWINSVTVYHWVSQSHPFPSHFKCGSENYSQIFYLISRCHKHTVYVVRACKGSSLFADCIFIQLNSQLIGRLERVLDWHTQMGRVCRTKLFVSYSWMM